MGFEDLLPAPPPFLPLPKGVITRLDLSETKLESAANYYGALVGEVCKKYMKCEMTRDEFLKEFHDIEKMHLEATKE